jgi:ketosteroid isomerase-like protein
MVVLKKNIMKLKENVDGYFDLLNKGQAMDAFEKYYSDDIVMQENSEEPRVGKDANRKFEIEFFSSIEEMHGSEIKAVSINEETGHVFIQSAMDATFKGMGRFLMEEVQVQTWKDGKIVNERFFYNRA